MKNINSSQILYPIWTKEMIAFNMADMQWKVNDLEIRLKSPYPLLFVSPSQPEDVKQIEIQPLPDKV